MKKIKEVFLDKDYNDGKNFAKAGYKLIKSGATHFSPPYDEFKLYDINGTFIKSYTENEINENLKSKVPLFKVVWENECSCGCGCEHCGTKKYWELPIPVRNTLDKGFIISPNGNIYDGNSFVNPKESYKMGNWFSTRKEAEKRLAQLKAITYCKALRDHCNELSTEPEISITIILYYSLSFKNYEAKALFIKLCDPKMLKIFKEI